jgi:hypothetical protein
VYALPEHPLLPYPPSFIRGEGYVERGGSFRGNSMTTVELFSPDNLAVIEIIRNFVA